MIEKKYEVLETFENTTGKFVDSLSQDNDKITYAQTCELTSDEFKGENVGKFVFIQNDKLNNLTFEKLLFFLKNLDTHQEDGRLKPLKFMLNKNKIEFKEETEGWKVNTIYQNKPRLRCCLCDKEIMNIKDSHNPEPLEKKYKNNEYRCCAECNFSKVVPARINLIKK